MSTVLCTFIVSFIQLWFTVHHLKLSIRQVFPWRDMGMRLGQTIVLGSVFWMIKYLFIPSGSGTLSILVALLLGGIWAIIYAVLNLNFIRQNWIALNRQEEEIIAED